MSDEFIEITNHDLIHMQQYYWEQGDIEWKLDALQLKISEIVKSNPKAKKICLLCSRQIGKSYWSVAHSLSTLIKKDKTIARIIAPTLSNCHDIVNDNLMRITKDAPQDLVTKRRSDMRWDFSNGSSLRLGALERAHVDAMNRGGNASLIIYEECGFVKGDDFLYGVNSVLGPQLLRSNGIEIFVSSPPEDPDHPLITQIKPECEELGTFFAFTVLDSPSIGVPQIIEAARRSGCVLSDDFIAALFDKKITLFNVHEYAAKTNSNLSDAFKREFLAEVVRPTTRMIVPDFNDSHIADFDDPFACKWNITIDWGGVRDMTVALLHTYDYEADLDLIREELIFNANTPTAEIVKALKSNWDCFRPENIWADVHGQTQVDLTNMGCYVQLPQKSNWLGSVQAMAVKFTLNRILVHTRCDFLRRTLKAGMFNRTKTDFDRTEKLGHCDAIAALMYAVRSQDRTTPFGDLRRASSSNVIDISVKEDESVGFAKTLNPKTFGKYKNG